MIINKTDGRIKNKLLNARNMKKFKAVPGYELDKSKTLFSSVNNIQETWKNTKIGGTGKNKNHSQVLLDYVGFLSKKGVTKMPDSGSGQVSKVQATEFGYIINRAEANNVVSEILYSLFTFAGSRGLVLFDGTAFKNHFASSVHLKVT